MRSAKSLLNNGRLRARKKLGQNFLNEPATAADIVQKAGIRADETVLEIGPGLGALTHPLAKAGGSVVAVEKDPRLAAVLRAELASEGIENVRVETGDILDFDIQALARSCFPAGRAEQAEGGGGLVVAGNLPYNISSPVLIQLIQNRGHICRAVLMFQKELADRLQAEPGSKAYGRITVILRYCADIRLLATIKASQFFPRPQVDSRVLAIRFRAPTVQAADEALFFQTVKAAFGQRRKTLKNALAGSEFRLGPHQAEGILQSAQIAPGRRAETLSVEEFVALSHGFREWGWAGDPPGASS